MKWSRDIDTGRPQDEIELLKQGDNWIPAPPAQRPPSPIAYPLIPEIAHTGSAQQVIKEDTSPIKRSVAALIATTLFTVLALAILVTVAYYGGLDDGSIMLLLIIILGAAVTVYGGADWLEKKYSPAGVALNDRNLTHVERIHAIDRQYDLAEKVLGVDRD